MNYISTQYLPCFVNHLQWMFSLSLSHALQDCPILRQYPNGLPYLKHTCDAFWNSLHIKCAPMIPSTSLWNRATFTFESVTVCLCVYMQPVSPDGRLQKTGHPLPPRATPAALSSQPELETHSSPTLLCLCLCWIKDEPFNIQVHMEQLINHTHHTCCERDRLAVYYQCTAYCKYFFPQQFLVCNHKHVTSGCIQLSSQK